MCSDGSAKRVVVQVTSVWRYIPLLLACLAAAPVAAQERVTLGFGRLFTNDALGDGQDRWQSGSYTLSLVRGPSWSGTLPDRPGVILEYRLRAAVTAASNLENPAPDDRRYAGTLAIGVHTHFDTAGFDVRAGVDLVGIGPNTGVGRFQEEVHEIFGLSDPDLSNQIGNRLRPTASVEVARMVDLGGARLRPFFEAQAGAETLVRAGADVTFGGFGRGGLMLRDTVSGQLYPGIPDDGAAGVSFVLGADVAHVFSSVYLPDGGQVDLTDTRTRLRGGINWNTGASEVFYGVTWLSKEFEGQPEGQLVGSLRLSLQF
jgi:Uncharacterized protein conserved in bacteria (DUF2219)